MSRKNLLLLGALTALSACSSFSGVMPPYTGDRYVPRPSVPPGQYTQQDMLEDRMDRRAYNEYEHREQCQDYRRVPRNSVEMPNCYVKRAATHGETVVQTTTGSVFHSYTVYFDLNKSNIRADQRGVLGQVASEIETLQPADITVTGFADRSGKPDYNQKLSSKRAKAVSAALTRMGVHNEVIDEKARGESDNAVPTADGVKMQANRRVVIDFRR